MEREIRVLGDAGWNRVTRTALIGGAGIGGLSAAISLRKAGWNVRVFERAASVRELGFALLVAPNAMAAIRELGVADVVLARGVAPTRGEARRMDGTILKRADYPPPEVMGGPTIVALRPVVHGALLEAVGEDTVTLGCEATGFSAAGDRATLRTADGDIAEGDLLVGADGAKSVIRRVLHPSEPPPRSAASLRCAQRCTAPCIASTGCPGSTTWDRGVESFVVRASDSGIYWALSLAEELVPAAGDGGRGGARTGARQERERRGRVAIVRTRAAAEDGGPGGPGTPDGANHGNDEPGDLLAARNRRPVGARQDLGEDTCGHQSPRGHRRQLVASRPW